MLWFMLLTLFKICIFFRCSFAHLLSVLGKQPNGTAFLNKKTHKRCNKVYSYSFFTEIFKFEQNLKRKPLVDQSTRDTGIKFLWRFITSFLVLLYFPIRGLGNH